MPLAARNTALDFADLVGVLPTVCGDAGAELFFRLASSREGIAMFVLALRATRSSASHRPNSAEHHSG